MKRALRYLFTILIGCPFAALSNTPGDRLAHADFSSDQTSVCANVQVAFADLSEAPVNDPFVSWQWHFGDGNTSSEINPLHTYTTSGLFSIKLIVTAQSGWKDSITRLNYVQVLPAPIVNLGPDTVMCDGGTMMLDAKNEGAIYYWSTGDVFQQIEIFWAGEYWVEVTANGCTTRDTILVYSMPSLYADFNYSETPGCLPSTVSFTNLSSACGGTIREVLWDFGDGNVTNVNNPAHIYTASGLYLVTLTVTDNSGSVTNTSQYVTVNATTLPQVDLGADTTVCQGTSLLLTAGIPNATYLWSTGETDEQISVTDPGSYWVIASVNGTCSGTDTIHVTFSDPVTPLFAYRPFPGCAPLKVQFTDHSGVCSGNVIDTWSWDFGDGTTSTEQNPLHVYTNEGTYTVQLTVTTTSGLVRTINLNVNAFNPVPLAVNLGGDTYFCENSSIQLNAGIPGATYSWSTGETGVAVNISTPGQYWVTVTKDNCVASDTIQVGMNPALTTAFGYTFETVCLPVTVRFRDSTLACNGNIETWLWDFGDGNSSSSQHPVHTYTTNGTYTVTLIVTTSNGSADVVSGNIFISSSMFMVNLGADTTVCTGNTHTLDAGNPGAQYVWNTGETMRSIVVNDGGSYWVRAERNGCITTDTIVIRNTLPVTAKIGMNVPAKCLPVPVQFADSSVIHCGEAINDWKWEFGDGAVSNAQHPAHTYTVAGTYSVQLTVTASNGVTITTTRQIVIENTKPILNLGADLTVCKGTTVPLDAGITDAVYSWSPAAGMSNATIRNPVVQPTATTTYSVTVTKCNYTLTDEIKVIIDSIRKPIIIQDNNILKATAADAYQWYKDNQPIAGAIARTYNARSLGYYTVKVGSGRGCENISDPFLYIPKHKNGKGLNGISIHCSPNPTNGLVNLVLDAQPEKPLKLTIIDRYGKTLLRMNITQQYNQLRLYMLPKGQYFFELRMGNEVVVIPVVIQ